MHAVFQQVHDLENWPKKRKRETKSRKTTLRHSGSHYGCDYSKVPSSCSAVVKKMNSFYVIVSIPFLLVLAGFNHAHGFTTFGKTPNNPQTPPPQPIAPAKPCGNHTECWSIPGTSCVGEPKNPTKKSCLCGDNKSPANGQCDAKHKGPNHLCTNDHECIFGSTCVPMTPGSTGQDAQKVCRCMEDYVAMDGECSSAGHLQARAFVIGLLVVLCRKIF